MAISFGSINTGLPKDIVKQIVEAEKIPIKNMEARKANYEERNKLVNELITIFQDLHQLLLDNNSARSLRELKVYFNEELVDVTLDQDIAQPGEYRFSVEQLARKSSAMTSGFEDPNDSYVGVGFVQYELPNGDVKDVYIDSDNASLNGVAKLINADKENGMRATVINDGSGSDAPWRLLISLEQVGDQNLANFPYFYFVDGEDDFYLDLEKEANDALVTLDGFEIELPSNSDSNIIPGATVDLKKAAPGQEFSIKIVEDKEAIGAKFNDIVEKINAVLAFIKKQNTMDANTNTRITLGGDVTLQTLEQKVRSLIFEPFETRFGQRRFGDLGIEFQKDGLLNVKKQKFDAFISKNYLEVSDLLVGYIDEDKERHDGFINKLEDLVTQVIRRPNGILRQRQNGIKSRIDQIDRQIESRERMIDKKEKMLKDKFAKLEGTISELKNQGAGLAALQVQTPNVGLDLGQNQQ